jgi:heat shock protein HtpX
MYTIIRTGLVAVYVLLTGVCFLFVLSLFGLYISWGTLILTLAGWGLFCFLSVYFLGPVHLFFRGRLRKPILEEETRLRGCFADVLKSAGCMKQCRLRIIEEKEEESFVFGGHTIAVSVSLLNNLTDEELKGLMAHELGHLISKDTMIAWAFMTASDLPRMVRRCLFAWRLLTRRVLILLVPLALLILIVLFLFRSKWVLPVMGTILLLLLSAMLEGLFRWLGRMLSRRCEYRQDAFAHRLGYGAGLRDALKKMARQGREQVNAYYILMHGTSPVIYDRIRRLERLLGMRIKD